MNEYEKYLMYKDLETVKMAIHIIGKYSDLPIKEYNALDRMLKKVEKELEKRMGIREEYEI